MGEVKIIGSYASFFCTRVEWALKIKGVEYGYIEEDIRNKSPLLVKYNPIYKKIPVLLHNDVPIPESLDILEYIDETWKHNPLLPQDPYQRAYARFWAKFGDDKIIPTVYGAMVSEKIEEKKKLIESAVEYLSFVEKEIEGKKFFACEEMGYLHLAMGWIGPWMSVMEELGEMKILDAKSFPCLCEWAENFYKVPIIKERLPSREILVDDFQGDLDYEHALTAQNP